MGHIDLFALSENGNLLVKLMLTPVVNDAASHIDLLALSADREISQSN